jgi:hypothetical protein
VSSFQTPSLTSRRPIAPGGLCRGSDTSLLPDSVARVSGSHRDHAGDGRYKCSLHPGIRVGLVRGVCPCTNRESEEKLQVRSVTLLTRIPHTKKHPWTPPPSGPSSDHNRRIYGQICGFFGVPLSKQVKIVHVPSKVSNGRDLDHNPERRQRMS